MENQPAESIRSRLAAPWFVFAGIGILFGAVAAFVLWPRHERPAIVPSFSSPSEATASTSSSPETAGAISTTGINAEMLAKAFDAREPWKAKEGTRVVILPHHVAAAREMASLVSAVEAPSVVYVVAPDHFSQGKTVFTTTDYAFQVGDKRIDPFISGVRSLDSLSTVKIDAVPFEKEHGVTALLPFFATAWPKTKIVPVIVRIDAGPDDAAALAEVIMQNLRKDSQALLVTSVDFSHYLPAEVADFHDVLAKEIVSSVSADEAWKVEIDSPGALAVGLGVARRLGLGDASVHAQTNSLRLLEAKIVQESTSHLFVSFAPGEFRSSNKTTLLFMGDMMFDRNVANRSQAAGSLEYPFAKIRGTEDRFFRGQDLVVGNLEGPVASKRGGPVKSIDFLFDPKILPVLTEVGVDVVSQANNHALDQGREGNEESLRLIRRAGIAVFGDQVRDDAASSMTVVESRGKKIAFLGFNTTDNPLEREDAKKAIQEGKAKADKVIVFMHWGAEYQDRPLRENVELAHWFIDQGVDALIGAHPHWMQSVEVYKGKPIAYSLGNFIFDQDWSPETGFGLVAGLVLDEKGSELHLFPIKIVESQPILLTGAERQKRLDHLSDVSDSSLSEQIKKGVLRVL